jgi:hypothetical protein
MLGITFLIAGAITLAVGVSNDALSMALTFGAIHLGYGVTLTLAPATGEGARPLTPEIRTDG